MAEEDEIEVTEARRARARRGLPADGTVPVTGPEEPLLRWFEFEHLPAGPLRDTSRQFHDLAHALVRGLPRTTERTVALRKLLESKDAAVRTALDL